MNEILLVVWVASLMLGVSYVTKKLSPLPKIYVGMAASILLVILVWIGGSYSYKKVSMQLLVTVVAVTSSFRQYYNLKKSRQS
jgi:uncharacterized membrane protein YfhO